MILALVLLTVGVFLSAFFSGSETGFYRLNRVRLVLDGLAGDWVAHGLLRLNNQPTIFVATVLVGNNIANYLTSLGMVLGAQALFPSEGYLPELLAPVLLAPLLFVYGELLPKNLFYEAPNRLLRRGGPALLACTILFLPVTILLGVLGKLLERLAGESPEQVQLTIARKELQRVFEEGHEAGIIRPAQRGLAQQLFAIANQPINSFAIPSNRIARARQGMSKDEIKRLARRQRSAAVPIEDAGPKRNLLGYIQVVDLYLDDSDALPPIRPLLDVPATTSFISALMRLTTVSESIGRIVGAKGETVGFVTTRQLSELLFRGQ